MNMSSPISVPQQAIASINIGSTREAAEFNHKYTCSFIPEVTERIQEYKRHFQVRSHSR